MPNKLNLRIATRKSPLALWQAEHVRSELLRHHPHLTIELVPLVTSGDQFLKDKLIAIGGKGLFVKELEEALLHKRADLAVHSMKDLPAFLPDGLMISAICTRQNPFDALLNADGITFKHLPNHGRIGTSSLRRQSQLLSKRPDLEMVTLRGNIQTRIEKMHAQKLDGIILAAAGLERMELLHLATEIFDEHIMLPACGQGAIGIECRSEDESLQALLAPLHDHTTALCVHTERTVNELLGGNCHVPVAVYCRTQSKTLCLNAMVASADGKKIIKSEQQGTLNQAHDLALQCVKQLHEQGANELLSSL